MTSTPVSSDVGLTADEVAERVLIRPFNWYRSTVLLGMIAGEALVISLPVGRDFFALEIPPASTWMFLAATVVFGALVIGLGPRVIPWWAASEIDRRGEPAELVRAT